MNQTLEPILERHPERRDALLPILREMHDALGYLPLDAMASAARHCRMAPVEVYGVATFHPRFRMHPHARTVLTVCRGTTCHLMGGALLYDELRHRLGICAGETTPDGLFSLNVSPCLGACTRAPALALNEETRGRVKPRQIAEILHEAGTSP
jgi:NADH:ubiquinone oxidoreductase subunit E